MGYRLGGVGGILGGGTVGGTTVSIQTDAPQMVMNLKNFDEALNYRISLASNEVLEWIRNRATTVYMVPGGDPVSDPPNPVPGPLKKRTGRLASAVFIIKTYIKYGHVFEGRVEVDSNKAIYGWAHEYGYPLTANQRRRLGRVFEFGQWRTNTHAKGTTKLFVRARPFMAPAAVDAAGYARAKFEDVVKEAATGFERLL